MNVFVAMLLLVQVISALGLIVFVLLHSGKGTGMSSMLGGWMPQASSGTGIIEKNLDRITVGFAVIFFVSSLLLSLTYKPGA